MPDLESYDTEQAWRESLTFSYKEGRPVFNLSTLAPHGQLLLRHGDITYAIATNSEGHLRVTGREGTLQIMPVMGNVVDIKQTEF